MNNLLRTWFSLPLLLAAALALAACASVGSGTDPTPLPTLAGPGSLTAEGMLLPVRYTPLAFPAGGRLETLLVSEGQEVSPGAVLARLGDLEPLQAVLAQARLEQTAARQALDALEDSAELQRTQSAQAVLVAQKQLLDAEKAYDHLATGDFQDELDDLQEAVDDAQERLDDAQEELDRYQDHDPADSDRKRAQDQYDDAWLDLCDARYERDNWQLLHDQAQAGLALAQARLADAQRFAGERQAGLSADDLALAQARLQAADAQEAAARRALDNAQILAPYGATVADVSDYDPGELLPPGAVVMVLADYSNWVVETRDLTEFDVAAVQVGQRVQVTPDALPELALAGVVESVSRMFGESRGDVVYTARVRLEQTDPRLRWGMTVTVTFE